MNRDAGERACVPDITRLSEVESELVQWLWDGRIPLAKLSLLEGHPGIGKSHLTLDFAARVTIGRAFPGDEDGHERGNVVILTAEDGLGDTVKPRLLAAGGNPKRVIVVNGFRMNGDDLRLPIIPDDIPAIQRIVAEEGAVLVVVDPLAAFLASGVNSWRDHDVRRALTPLAMLADETGAAVKVVRHLTKSPTGGAITAGGGSIGMIGAARAAMLVAVDPEDESRRVLAVVKSNLAVKPPSLSFRLESTPDGRSRIAWCGSSSHSADALIAAQRDDGERGALDVAMEFLRAHLADHAAHSKKDVLSAARSEGIATRTLERAAAKLNVFVGRKGAPGKDMVALWTLPAVRSPYISRQVGETERNGLSDNGLVSRQGVWRDRGEIVDGEVVPFELEQLEIDAYGRQNGGAP